VANEISAIAPPCNTPNAKALRRIQLIEASAVLPRPFYAVSIDPPSLKAGKSWKEIQFIKKTGSYTEAPKTHSDHGDYLEQSLDFSIKGDSVAFTEFHYLLMNRELAALITDQNGLTKFVPRLKSKSRLIKNDRTNQYDISLTFDSKHPAPVVVGFGDDGSGGGGSVGIVIKSTTPLRSVVRDGDLVHLERTDGGSFVADGIPLGNFSFQIKILPSNEIVNNGGTNYGDLIICGLNMYIPSPTVSLIISHRHPTPLFENFQYGT
jgi:hypothetical protein